LVFTLAVSALAFTVENPATSLLSFDSDGAKNRPVSKVITLLKDMLKQLEKEAEEDEEIYDKMACWCETNDKDKTKSVSDAEARISDLTTKIEELTAQSARLNTEIANLNKEVAGNQKSLDAATAIRTKQLAEFNGEEKDLLESISALKSAVTVLSKHNSMLQVPRSHMLGVAATLQHELTKHADMLEGLITPSARKMIGAFVQAPEDFLQAPSYAPASGEIFGILKQMKETFETNLSSSQKEEMANQKAYTDLKAAKEVEIAAGQAQVDTKTQELADTDEKNAQSKQDIEDTKNSLSADEQFLMMLKEKCSMTDGEWEERQKTRQLEMEACSKALAVLSSDDAHDLFTKTFNFVQVSSNSNRRAQASQLLKSVSAKVGNPRLATLAEAVQLDAFTRVKKAIDDMVGQLVKEKADEIKHKDFCTDEFNSNELSTEKKTRAKSDVEAKISDLEMSVKQTGEAIDALKAEVSELQVQLKRAGEDREKQNKEFQTTVADQRATQKLLTQAMNVLKGFYAKKAAAALLQTAQPAGPPPPPGFDSYKKNAAAGGVMGMIQQIINDAKSMEAETIRAEEDSQKAYEEFVKDTNGSVEQKGKDIVHKSEIKAKAEAALVQAKADQDAVMLELEQLGNAKADLHSSCDFIVKNFDIRQSARDEEIEALKQAKAILSGAKFSMFLQA